VSKREKRYKELLAELKENRVEEKRILTEMDFLWQMMSIEERNAISETHTTWPPPASGTR